MRVPKILSISRRYTEDLHIRVLNLALREKHEVLRHFQRELIVIRRNLEVYLTKEEIQKFLQYEERLTAFFKEKVNKIHKRKFEILRDLQRKEYKIELKNKWFVNKTNLDIPTNVQWTLSLGPKHALPIRKDEIPILKMIAEGEDFIQTIERKEEQEIARTRLTTIIDSHMNKMRLTSRDKFMLSNVKETKQFLKRNRDVLILKADKGNTTVALYKRDYDIRINNIVGDSTKYKLVNKDPTNKLQRMNNDIVETLFKLKIITVSERNKLKTNIAIAPRLYGLPKIHKEEFPLRPICSFINSPSYELCKYITNILRKITVNSKYNVKDSVQFKERLKGQILENDEKLISLDVISLFPSIPVDLALEIIEGKWDLIKNFTEIRKNHFLKILKFCIEDNRYFKYNGNIYLQESGLPMGSPASPIVADIVMENLLDISIDKLRIKPRLMTKYVDDLFCLVSQSTIDDVLRTFNEFNPNIKFTLEVEKDSKLNYLDTLIIRKGRKMAVDWYQKPTASGRIINYFSKHNKRVIINTARNLIDRVLKISDRQFHRKNIRTIKSILRENDFPINIVNRLLGQFGEMKLHSYNRNNYINNRSDSCNGGSRGERSSNSGSSVDGNSDCNDNTNDDTNRDNNNDFLRNMSETVTYRSMTYIPGISERLRKSKLYNSGKFKIAFTMYNTLGKLFSRTKDKVDKSDMSNIVYKIPCSGNDKEDCNKVYVGTTKNKLKTRLAGHKSDQKYRDINTQKTALSSHCSELNHYPKFENVSVLNIENNYKRRLLLEMLQIISVPTTHRINFKTDTEGLAQSYRHLILKK